MASHKFLVFTIECSNRSNINYTVRYIYRRDSSMVRILYNGYMTSEFESQSRFSLHSSKAEQDTVTILIGVRFILRAPYCLEVDIVQWQNNCMWHSLSLFKSGYPPFPSRPVPSRPVPSRPVPARAVPFPE